MKDFFHNNGFKVLLAIVFLMFGLILYTASVNNSIFTNLLGFISTPMQKVSAMVTNNATVTVNNVTRSAADLQAENDALKKEINVLRNQMIDYSQIKKENEQQKSYLELKKDHPDFQFVSAAVIGRDPNELFYGFTVDKGSLAKVKVNDPVITDAGLVGWVSSVNSTFCKVTTILSPDTNVGAVDSVCGDSGVLNTNKELADQGYTKLGYLTTATKVQVGNIIMTSGLGGIYPKGLQIGNVKEVKHEEYDVSLSATVEPFVDVKTLHDVFIITYFEGQGEGLSGSTFTSSPTSSSSSSSSSSSNASSKSDSSSASTASTGG